MFCKNCGKDVRDDSQFCWNCGTNIEIKKNDSNDSVVPIIEESSKKIKCKNCGNEIYEKTDICPHCGTHLRVVVTKNPGIAAVLSFFIPGLGQIYDGEIIIGIAFFIIELLLIIVGVSLIRTSQIREGAAFMIVNLIFWAYNIYRGYKIAEEENKRQY